METVRHDAAMQRFETADGRALADYRLDGGRMLLTHTFVPVESRGRGLAAQLVTTALDYARREGLKVVPVCSYVETFLRRHPEYADLRASDV